MNTELSFLPAGRQSGVHQIIDKLRCNINNLQGYKKDIDLLPKIEQKTLYVMGFYENVLTLPPLVIPSCKQGWKNRRLKPVL